MVWASEFLVKWFKGPLGKAEYRDVGFFIHDAKDSEKVFKFRSVFSSEGFLKFLENSVGKDYPRTNIFMGIGAIKEECGIQEIPVRDLTPECYAFFDTLPYDFDCEGDPELAIRKALEFADYVKGKYGVDSVVYITGFKGARVVVPLAKPTDYEGYKLLWYSILPLTLASAKCRSSPIIDRSLVEDYKHTSRPPFTYNYKNGKTRLARIIKPKIRAEEFDWSLLEPLNPGDVLVYRVSLPDLKPLRLINRKASSKRGPYWIEQVLSEGLPDGRKRFILWVASRYLVNVKGLGLEEALGELEGFLEASCRNHGNCSRIYSSWLRSVLRGVAAGGYKPPSLRRLREKHPDLYTVIREAAGRAGQPKGRLEPLPEPFHSFLEDTGLTVFSYEDVKRWLESRKGRVSSGEWSRVTRRLRKLAEEGLLGRMYLVNGEWKDYGPGPVEKPPSRIVRFYAVR